MGVKWLLLIATGFLVLGALSSTRKDEQENNSGISKERIVRSALSEANVASHKKEQNQKIKKQKIKRNIRKNNPKIEKKKNDKESKEDQKQKKPQRRQKNISKQKNKRKQEKKISQSQKGKKNKMKIWKRKIKQKRKRKTMPKIIPVRQTQTCSGDSPVSETCMDNAKSVLVFEATLVTNYLKQSKQLIRHAGQTENKMGKKGEFFHAAEHMKMAIGGNMSAPLCGKQAVNSDARKIQKRKLDLHLENYEKLMNCSADIKKNCTVPPEAYNETMLLKVKECNSSMEEFRTFTKTCMTTGMKLDATGQCDCWAEAKTKMDAIKVLKCSVNKQKKKVTEDKRRCIDTFTKCKKMEDESVNLIHTCMNDHSMYIINQTGESLQSGVMKDTSKALAGADDQAKAVMSGKLDLSKQLDIDLINEFKDLGKL